MTLKLLAKIIWETFQWVAILGGVLGLITGVALIFNSGLMLRISERMNVWISTRQAMRPLEAPIDVGRSLYRAHRIVGVLLFLGAVFTLYVLLVRFKGPEVVNAFAWLLKLRVARWAAESLRVFLVIANFAALILSVVMVVRPSALKGIETWANRSYSARQATKPLDIQRPGPDKLARTSPRLLGAALALGGIYILASFGYLHFVGR